MNKKTTTPVKTDFEKLEKFLQDLSHNQKISDQKTADSFDELRFKIMAEAARSRQEFKSTIRAEVQVANKELEEKLEEVQTNLNKRIAVIQFKLTKNASRNSSA